MLSLYCLIRYKDLYKYSFCIQHDRKEIAFCFYECKNYLFIKANSKTFSFSLKIITQ